MKAEAFVPGHISCVFRPVRAVNVMETGSLGYGIRMDLGCRASVSMRDDEDTVITVNGEVSDAPVTRYAIEKLDLRRGFDIRLEHDLPMEQGFGTSASGTYAAAVCACDLAGMDRIAAIKATHEAECTLGGGLGDLLAIESRYGIPVRGRAGPPVVRGWTEDSGLELKERSLIVFNEPLSTAPIINDDDMSRKIAQAGDAALRSFYGNPTVDSLFSCANTFSEEIGLESDEVSSGISKLRDKGYRAGMCMLGNSIYTDAPKDKVSELFPDCRTYTCSSFSGPIKVTRKE